MLSLKLPYEILIETLMSKIAILSCPQRSHFEQRAATRTLRTWSWSFKYSGETPRLKLLMKLPAGVQSRLVVVN